MDQRVIAMKGYSIFPKAPGTKPHQRIQLSVISRTLVLIDPKMRPKGSIDLGVMAMNGYSTFPKAPGDAV